MVNASGDMSRSVRLHPVHLSTTVRSTDWPLSGGNIRQSNEREMWKITGGRNYLAANRVVVGIYTIVASVGA